jgi:hypothetical protein
MKLMRERPSRKAALAERAAFFKRLENGKSSERLRVASGRSMTYKAYIDNIKAKTGKDPEYFRAQAKEKGLASHGELLAWLKSDCGLEHGHANAIILYIQNPALAKKKIQADARREKATR